MSGLPEFSPSMLRAFLHAHCRRAHFEEPEECGFQTTKRRELAVIRKRARVTHFEINFAWMGRLREAAARERLWCALGLNPADYGIRLLHGDQEKMEA
ncbi:hypothetical protein [Pararhizobium sp.]|uniref:hypothetical protein n=1 Tax=Pararhizobium sp. TaxID=1977563 RepID=UPI003D0F65AE